MSSTVPTFRGGSVNLSSVAFSQPMGSGQPSYSAVRRAAYDPGGGLASVQQEGSFRAPAGIGGFHNSVSIPVAGVAKGTPASARTSARRTRSPQTSPVRYAGKGNSLTASVKMPASGIAPTRTMAQDLSPRDAASLRAPSFPRPAREVLLQELDASLHLASATEGPLGLSSAPLSWRPTALATSSDNTRLQQMYQELLDSVELKIQSAFDDLKSFSAVGLSTLAEQIDAETLKREEFFRETRLQLEEQRGVAIEAAHRTATATLKKFEQVTKNAAEATLQLESELDRVRSCFEQSSQTQQAVTALRAEFEELRSNASRPVSDALSPEEDANAEGGGLRYLDHSIRELRTQHQLQTETLEEMWHARQRTGTRIGELVCGIEEVATALTSKDQAVHERLETMQAELTKLSTAAEQSKISSSACSLSAFPLSTVKEDGEEAEALAEEVGQHTLVLAALKAMQGDLNEVRARSDQIQAGDASRASKIADDVRECERKRAADSSALETCLTSEMGRIHKRVDELQLQVGSRAGNPLLPTQGLAISSNAAAVPASPEGDKVRQGDTGSDGGESFDARAAVTALAQLREDVARLDQRLLAESEALSGASAASISDLRATTGRLSGELKVARAEIANSASLANEAIQMVASMKVQVDDEAVKRAATAENVAALRAPLTMREISRPGSPAEPPLSSSIAATVLASEDQLSAASRPEVTPRIQLGVTVITPMPTSRAVATPAPVAAARGQLLTSATPAERPGATAKQLAKATMVAASPRINPASIAGRPGIIKS